MAGNSNEIEIIVDVDDKASDKIESIAGKAEKIGTVLTSSMSKLGDLFASAGTQVADFGMKMGTTAASTAAMGASTTAATGGLNLLVGAAVALAFAIPSLTIGFAALAPAILAIVGVAGAAATALAGLSVAGATLGLGLGGLGDAWSAYDKQQKAGGGGAKAAGDQAYQAARRIENAEYSLGQAKRAAARASNEVADAIERERRRIADLNAELRVQQVTQERAADAVEKARDKLAWAKRYGDQGMQDDAALELREAEARYAQESQQLKDLQEDKAKADKNGVMGSDQVKSALEREADAARAVTQAQLALADAKRKTASASGGAAGAVNEFNEAMAKLSPNARKLVMTLLELRERFAGLKRAVQDRLLAGASEAIRDLADKWGPRLLPILGGMADAINLVAKGLLRAFGDKEFIDNIERASKGFEGFLGFLGQAGESLIDAFGRIAGAASPVLIKIGEIIADIARRFDEWIKSAEKSGKLQSFMEKAAHVLQQIYDIGKLAVGIAVEFFKILFPGSEDAGLLDNIQERLQQVKEWLGDPKNAEKIREFFRKFGQFFDKLVHEWIPDLKRFASLIAALVRPTINFINALSRLWTWLSTKIPAAFRTMKNAAGGIWDGLVSGFKGALNWIIDRWNGLSFSLGPVRIDTPNVGHLASGGVSGGGLTWTGERGPEISNLAAGTHVRSHGDSMRLAGQSGGGGDVRVIQLVVSGKTLAEVTLDPMRAMVQRDFGGSVQNAYGRP